MAVRAYLTMKKVGAFYSDLFILWGILGFGCVIHNANQKSKELNVTQAYEFINK
jgi:hypothetical protein